MLPVNTRPKPVTAWPGERSEVMGQESVDSRRKIQQQIHTWNCRAHLNKDRGDDDYISYIWLTLWGLFKYGRVWASWFCIQVVHMELSNTDWRKHANKPLATNKLYTLTQYSFFLLSFIDFSLIFIFIFHYSIVCMCKILLKCDPVLWGDGSGLSTSVINCHELSQWMWIKKIFMSDTY